MCLFSITFYLSKCLKKKNVSASDICLGVSHGNGSMTLSESNSSFLLQEKSETEYNEMIVSETLIYTE